MSIWKKPDLHSEKEIYMRHLKSNYLVVALAVTALLISSGLWSEVGSLNFFPGPRRTSLSPLERPILIEDEDMSGAYESGARPESP